MKGNINKGYVIAIIAFSLLYLTASYSIVSADSLSDLKKEVKTLNDKVEILEATSGGEDDYKLHSIDLQGYYDFTFVDESFDGSNKRNGTFRQHHMSLFFGATREKWKFFTEVEFEFGPKIDLEGSTTTINNKNVNIRDGGTDKVEILIETAWLEYSFANFFTIRTGKHLTPFGWWNQNHYPILVLTTSRPESSNRIFPNTTTGIQFYGSLFLGDLQADYNLYYVNDIDNAATNKWDADSDKGVGGRFVLHVPLLDKFDIGFSSLGGRSNNTHKNLYLGFDELIQIGPFELLSEFAYNNRKTLSTGVKFYQKGYYIQPSVTIPTDLGDFSLVYRYDYVNLNSIGLNSKDKTINTLGVNYKPRPDVALKAEVNWIHPENNNGGKKREYTDTELSVTIYF